MKKFLILNFLCAGMAFAQNQYAEDVAPGSMQSGVYYQTGPGDDNSALSWAYPYATKLTVNGNPYRNFEILMDKYPYGNLSIRQWDATNSIWSDWRSVLVSNAEGRIGFGITAPTSKFEVLSDIGIRSTGTRGNARLFLDRGSDGRDAAIVSFGEGGNYTWNTGLLYAGGVPTPDFYISQNSRIRDSNGDYVHVPEFTIKTNGDVGIGTLSPDAKLTVKGTIHTEEVRVDLSVPAPDYVFKEGYELLSLEDAQKFINEHGHLPNIPSAHKMEAEGLELGIMNMKLLEKIEELTLYIIELKADLDNLKTKK
ncbi:MAG: hypothetical protein V7724_10900 [Sediminicola sp.]